MPDAQIVAGAVADIFDALVVVLGDTHLEPDLEDLLCEPERAKRGVSGGF